MSACCVPGSPDGAGRERGDPRPGAEPHLQRRPGPQIPLRAVPAGEYRLGDHFDEGYPADGELPVHTVSLAAFGLGATTVTNVDFAAFVEATGHVTTAEAAGSSAVFHLQVRAPRSAVVGHSPQAPWWVAVSGADWRHPAGPRSDLDALEDHPVVHISHDDAHAYCDWVGGRLPTEAEWEAAARGGLVGARFPWGNDLEPSGRHVCNVFQGDFPNHDTAADGWSGTSPVGSYAANGYGLHDMAGNVWEWCADWFDPEEYRRRAQQGSGRSPRGPTDGPTVGTARVIRGGSFLCHHTYCHRYRVAARSAAPSDSGASNLGFRCARDDVRAR